MAKTTKAKKKVTGKLGDTLLRWYANGDLWDVQILIVPEQLVPKKEKSFDAGNSAAAAE